MLALPASGFMEFTLTFDNLPLVDQRGLFISKVNLQSQTIRLIDNGADCGVDDLVVQTDFNVVADFVLRLVAFLGWHTRTLSEIDCDTQP